jgi:hypothetical protein
MKFSIPASLALAALFALPAGAAETHFPHPVAFCSGQDDEGKVQAFISTADFDRSGNLAALVLLLESQGHQDVMTVIGTLEWNEDRSNGLFFTFRATPSKPDDERIHFPVRSSRVGPSTLTITMDRPSGAEGEEWDAEAETETYSLTCRIRQY